MNDILKRVKDIKADCCVTILLNTHRTIPDNEKDSLLLKNLVKEAVKRLQAECKAEDAKRIAEKLDRLSREINHRYNLESLVLFVNKDIAEYARLPLPVTDRVIIDQTFATRDLIRTLLKEKKYYVLVLSRDKARLIEAFNDKVVREIEDGFPVENTSLYPSQKAEAAIANRLTSLQQEFFNIVDKQLLNTIKENPQKVFICTEDSNYHQYLKVADQKEVIIGNMGGNRMAEKAHHIVSAAWPVVLQSRKEKLKDQVRELEKAVDSGKVVTDFSEVWNAVNQGRGQTLFVQEGYFQPARLVNNTVELVQGSIAGKEDVIDDIIDEMIEINFRSGGDCVFLPEEKLKDFRGLALTTRY